MVSVYLPVFILAGLSRKVYGIQAVSPSLPYAREAQLTFDESLMDSCEVMVKIGGYIMLFSILVFYITGLPLHNPAGKAALLGFVEITTGIRAISGAIPSMAGGMWIAAYRIWRTVRNLSDKERHKKCRIIHPALCSMESGSQSAFCGNLYSVGILPSLLWAA